MMQKVTNKINFHFLIKPAALTHRQLLKSFILLLFKLEGKTFESLTIIFCSDQYLLAINNEFLEHNYFTDIITFNLAERNTSIIGEIYISVDRVRDNAKKLAEPFSTELTRVIFHGILHLCDYKDKSKRDLVAMRSKEEYYLNRYAHFKNVSRGTNC